MALVGVAAKRHLWVRCHFQSDWSDQVVSGRNPDFRRQGATRRSPSVRPYVLKLLMPQRIPSRSLSLYRSVSRTRFMSIPSIPSPCSVRWPTPAARSSATPPPLPSPRQQNKRRVVATVAAVIGVSGGGDARWILSSQHRASYGLFPIQAGSAIWTKIAARAECVSTLRTIKTKMDSYVDSYHAP